MALRAVLQGFQENPEARRLALIFAVVYFAQGMWYLPNLSLTFLLKETFHLSAGQSADFFAITIIPWLMSIYNGATQLSQNVGGRLYDLVGFNTLILISAGFTALGWFLLPLVRVEEIEARAREQAVGTPAQAGS